MVGLAIQDAGRDNRYHWMWPIVIGHITLWWLLVIGNEKLLDGKQAVDKGEETRMLGGRHEGNECTKAKMLGGRHEGGG